MPSLRPLAKRASTVARGTAYEKQCQAFLAAQLNMPLMRCGRANDNGIDLRGTWNPLACLAASSSSSSNSSRSPSPVSAVAAHPSDAPPPRSYRVIAQCKRYAKKLGPSYVRELIGTSTYYHPHDPHDLSRAALPGEAAPPRSPTPAQEVSHLPDGSNAAIDILSILFSSSGFSQESYRRIEATQIPLLLLHLEAAEEAFAALPGDDAESEGSEDASAIDWRCKGAIGNRAWQNATEGRLRPVWAYLFPKDFKQARQYVTFQYDGIPLHGERTK